MTEKLPPDWVEIEGESLIDRRVRLWDLKKKLRGQKVKPKSEYIPSNAQLYFSLNTLRRRLERLETQVKGCRCNHDR